MTPKCCWFTWLMMDNWMMENIHYHFCYIIWLKRVLTHGDDSLHFFEIVAIYTRRCTTQHVLRLSPNIWSVTNLNDQQISRAFSEPRPGRIPRGPRAALGRLQLPLGDGLRGVILWEVDDGSILFGSTIGHQCWWIYQRYTKDIPKILVGSNILWLFL